MNKEIVKLEKERRLLNERESAIFTLLNDEKYKRIEEELLTERRIVQKKIAENSATLEKLYKETAQEKALLLINLAQRKAALERKIHRYEHYIECATKEMKEIESAMYL